MKRIHFFIIALLLLLPGSLRAQGHRYSIGIEFGDRGYQYTYTDPGGRLINEPSQLRMIAGISGRWYASERWTTEVGFQQSINPQKNVNFNFSNPPRISGVIGLGQAERHYFIRQYYNPLVLKPFKGASIAVGPHAGIGFSRFTITTKGPYEFITPGGGPRNEPEEITAQATIDFPQTESWALEVGLNAHFMLGDRVHLRYQYGRYLGLSTVTNISIEYQSSLSPMMNSATISSRGTGLLHTGLIAYRFGRSNPVQQRRVREES